jgi:hypothetical protein
VTFVCDSGKSWTGSIQTGGMRTKDSSVRGPSEDNPVGDDSSTPGGDFRISTSRPGKGFPIPTPGTGRGAITMHDADYQGSHGSPTIRNSCQFKQIKKMMEYTESNCGRASVPIRIQYTGKQPRGSRGNGRSDPQLHPKAIPVP